MNYQKFSKNELVKEIINRNNEIKLLQKNKYNKTISNERDLLIESESKLKESQRVARLGHYSFNILKGIWTNSEELDRIFGIDKNFNRDVEGWLKIVHPNYVELMQNHLLVDVIQKRGQFNKEYKIISISGKQEKWVQGKGNLKFNEIGEPIEMFGTIQDITDRKLIEEALQESEYKLRKLFDKSKDAIFVVNLITSKYIDANKSAEEMTGYSLQELKNINYLDLVTEEIKKKLKMYYHYGEVIEINDIEYLHKDKSIRIANLIIIPINKSLIYVIGQDKTKEKIINNELIEAKNKALASDKMKSEFLAQMSHEIRSPINVIMNFLSLIKEETSGLKNEILKSAFSSIDSSTKRIIRTIDMILNMSDLQLGTYTVTKNEIEICSLVKKLYNEYKNLTLSKNLEFILNIDVKNNFVTIDDYALEQIIANLIDNAIKYTEYGFIELSVKENKEKYIIEVKDTGIGISKEFLPEIFSAFSQESKGYTRKFDGTGLGLSLVKNYCQLINAIIKVNSEKGKGSTFRLSFPKTL
ncbi:MAG: PAS domain-containing sensor histidine kinase [Ignavibacteriales bacterium]|nr:PAS domain-containing sensor histidine kinase [Ignavibacteriales bacterium]